MNINLVTYEQIIRSYALKQSITTAVALDRFMVNLAVMRDHYTGFGSSVNFRELGQLWNALPSSQRIAQRDALRLKLISAAARSRGE